MHMNLMFVRWLYAKMVLKIELLYDAPFYISVLCLLKRKVEFVLSSKIAFGKLHKKSNSNKQLFK